MKNINQESLAKIYEEKQHLASGRNSIILSDAGYGLNTIVKTEIRWLLENTEDEIFIIDKDGEFPCLYEDERATLYKLSMTDWCINPLDLSLVERTRNNPFYDDKLDFLFAFIEQIAGPMTQTKCSVVDKAFQNIYTDFKEKKVSEAPTIHDLVLQLVEIYKYADEYSKEAAKYIIDALKAVKDIPFFTGKTTIKHDTRITILDISEFGPYVDKAMLCCLEFVNQLSKENYYKRKRTTVFVQNVDMLKNKENNRTTTYISFLWKHSRMLNRGFTFIFDHKADYIPDLKNRSVRIEFYNNIHALLCNAPWIMVLNPNEQDKGHGDVRVLDFYIDDYERTYFEFGINLSSWLKKNKKKMSGLVMADHISYFDSTDELIRHS